MTVYVGSILPLGLYKSPIYTCVFIQQSNPDLIDSVLCLTFSLWSLLTVTSVVLAGCCYVGWWRQWEQKADWFWHTTDFLKGCCITPSC